MAMMVMGCLSEMIGYGGRLLLWENPFGFAGFLVQISKFEGSEREESVSLIRCISLYYAGTDVVYGCDLCHVVEDVCGLFRAG